ncbi:transglutaminaseTgpA domain-containing protein [Microbacterium sp. NPDC057650]|uniref:transglutaminase family protein n=1 Tax=unclassified Microbacterium TaxID=2609290 RepID=UPI0036735EF5
MADPSPQSAWGVHNPDAHPAPVAPALLAAAATAVAVWPYTSAVLPGAWTMVVVVVIIATAVTGILMRKLLSRRSAAARAGTTLAAQLAVVSLVLTTMLVREAAWFGIIPTPTALRLASAHLGNAFQEVLNGVAPIEATTGMAVLLGCAFGLLAVLIDQFVALRWVIPTALVVAVVGAVPMVIVSGGANVVWFVLLAVLVLVLFRYGARHDDRAPRRSSGTVATAVGAVAVVAALVIAPGLPVSATLPGTGPTVRVDATLRLGDDLRRPEGVPVMSVVTSAASAPYLRLATLSRFDGEIWRPDRPARQPIDDGFGSADWSSAVKTEDERTSIRVNGMSSSRLPLPYAAEKISGLDGGWEAMPRNRTASSDTRNADGADYTVTSTDVQPSLEQIRAARARGADDGEVTGELPPVIAETAREVTAKATNDYDRLIALQNWFRSQFTYSLETPVDQNFDGTGAEAVVSFLSVRSGYCIHFAGAFALMAHSMGMPVRIVVGYLPGRATDQERDDRPIYEVDSDQLHSWPEVFFEGIGWVPFEPTATLGVPTDFAAAGGGNGEAPEAPTPTTAPTTAPSPAATDDLRDPGAQGGAIGGRQVANPAPFLWTMLGLLVALLLPALIRLALQFMRLRRASRGDALVAWRELQATMVDLRMPVSDADTARTRGDWIVAETKADAADVAALVRAAERAAYAKTSDAASALAGPLTRVDRALRASSSVLARLGARLVPRSLLPRRRDGAAVVTGR